MQLHAVLARRWAGQERSWTPLPIDQIDLHQECYLVNKQAVAEVTVKHSQLGINMQNRNRKGGSLVVPMQRSGSKRWLRWRNIWVRKPTAAQDGILSSALGSACRLMGSGGASFVSGCASGAGRCFPRPRAGQLLVAEEGSSKSDSDLSS